MALPCFNDVLGGCNRAFPSLSNPLPTPTPRHLPATSEHGVGHLPSSRLGLGRLPVQCPDAAGEKARVKIRGGLYGKSKEMATHSSVLAWRIPGMGEPGGLPSQGSHRV